MTRLEPRHKPSRFALCGSPADRWPPPPIPGSAQLIPIESWAEMWAEARVTGVVLDAFWLDSVEGEVAYFFRWTGPPRATVLVVWESSGVTHIECRGADDRTLPAGESREIEEEVHRLFAEAGYRVVAEGTA